MSSYCFSGTHFKGKWSQFLCVVGLSFFVKRWVQGCLWANFVRTPVTLQTGLASHRSLVSTALEGHSLLSNSVQAESNHLCSWYGQFPQAHSHSGYRGTSISARVCFYFRFTGEWLLNSAKESKHQVPSLWMKALLCSKIKFCTEKAASNDQLS